jgi:GNAT superfamily N-acetyltransferase
MRSTSRPRYPPPIILPSERHDIPELVRIYLDAESSNLLHNLVLPSRKKAARELIKVLDDNFDNPQLRLMKAVDPESGDITAMAAWQLKGYAPEELEGLRPDAVSKVFPPLQLNGGIFHGKVEGKPPPGLGQYVNDQMTSFLDDWTRDLKHLYLALLMTDPRYQRRGIGTAMLKWGHEKAGKLSS